MTAISTPTSTHMGASSSRIVECSQRFPATQLFSKMAKTYIVVLSCVYPSCNARLDMQILPNAKTAAAMTFHRPSDDPLMMHSSTRSLSPQSKAHQRVWLRMHHFIHVLGGNVHQATRPPGHEQELGQCALTNDSYVATIQMSRLADHCDSISHYEF